MKSQIRSLKVKYFNILKIKQNYNQRIVSMSVAKKKSQRSQNNSSLSQVSNSQNLRDSSLFKNQYLVQIQNIHIVDPLNQRKQQNQANSTKKKVTTQMKQQQVKTRECCDKSKQNKMVNYAGMSKILQQRNILIRNQQKHIQNLKVSLDRVRKDLQTSKIEFENKKIEDFQCLKKQEKENEENIKQLEILRVGVRQLKTKIDNLEMERQVLQKKNNQHLRENQQLTIKITSLKQQYLSKIPDQRAMADLKNQLSVMKEQAKLTKQFQMQKNSLEQRCRNFEKKINDYIIRYNEVQGDYNEAQIKYYRAQKQNDDLKMNIQELEIENKNIKKMLEEQKKILGQQTEKWRTRISRLQDYQKSDRNLNQLETKMAINEIEDRCVRLEQLSVMEDKIEEKNAEINSLKIKISCQTNEAYQLNNQISILYQQIEKNKQQFQELNINHAQKCLQTQKLRQNAQKMYQQFQIQKQIEIKELKAKVERKQNQISNLKENIKELQTKLSYILKQNSQSLSKKSKQYEEMSKRWQIKQSQMKVKIQSLYKLNEENSVSISLLKAKNTDFSIDVIQQNEILSKKNEQIQLNELRIQQKTQEIQQMNHILRDRIKQNEYLKKAIAQKNQDYQILSSLLKERVKQSEQLQSKANRLNSELENSLNRLRANETQLMMKQSELRKKQQQICEKNNIIQLKQSEKTNWMCQLSLKSKAISDLDSINYQLKEQIRQLKNKINQSASNIEDKQLTYLRRIDQIEKRLREQCLEIENKAGEISKKQSIISNTNAQLREIKVIVQEYKQKIQVCSNTIMQADRKLENQEYLTKENLLKLEEEVKYFRSKYEDCFRQTIQHSNKLYQVQRHLTDQINRNTDLLKKNSQLEEQISIKRVQLQTRASRQKEDLTNQKQKLKSQIAGKDMMLNSANMRLRQYQCIGKQLQSKISSLANEIIRIKEQQQYNISKNKAEHAKNIEQLSGKYEQSIRIFVQTEKIKHQKEMNAQIQREQHLGMKLEEAQKQILQKDSIIMQNYDIISVKQQELKSILKYKQSAQNQEIKKMKEYNVKLSQQIQQISQQYNQNYLQLREAIDQCQKLKLALSGYQKQNFNLLNKNTELENQINSIRSNNFTQSEESIKLITQMRCQIVGYEEKIKCQVQEISLWMQKYEMSQRENKKVHHEVNKVNRSYLEQSNRRNRQSNRQIEAYKTQIQLLQDQNMNLQKVMDKQLGKRKIIIEQLINEKKMLYEQIGHH